MNMDSMNLLKRMKDGEEESAPAEPGQKKRKRAVSNVGPVELNEEEQLLLKLKDEEGLAWKDIATRFTSELGKSYQVPALQMRFKRLRERMRTWTETDVSLFFDLVLLGYYADSILSSRSQLSNKLMNIGKSTNSTSSLPR